MGSYPQVHSYLLSVMQSRGSWMFPLLMYFDIMFNLTSFLLILLEVGAIFLAVDVELVGHYYQVVASGVRYFTLVETALLVWFCLNGKVLLSGDVGAG